MVFKHFYIKKNRLKLDYRLSFDKFLSQGPQKNFVFRCFIIESVIHDQNTRFVIVLHMDGIMVKIKYSPFLLEIKPLEAPQGSPFENLCSNCYCYTFLSFFFLLSIVGSVAILSKSYIPVVSL